MPRSDRLLANPGKRVPLGSVRVRVGPRVRNIDPPADLAMHSIPMHSSPATARRDERGSALLASLLWLFAFALFLMPFLRPRDAVGSEEGDATRVEADAPFAADVARFDQLFPLGHAYLGIADVVARQNVIAASAGVSLRPLPALTAELAMHHFRRAGRADGLFADNGSLLRAGDPTASREVGEEIDLSFAYRFDAHLQLGGGWAHFFPGHFLAQTGPARDLDFAYWFAQFTF